MGRSSSGHVVCDSKSGSQYAEASDIHVFLGLNGGNFSRQLG
ncbi:hypothetical protein [Rhizobium sp. No.120]